ncbi:transcription termination/antitermination protein NusA [Patescibacteria group bacterium]|nr:transcription termination/antitermination protein NusA [Patescibacteria group bacterium]
MSLSPFTAAIQQICSEKGISEERVIETVEAAIAAAYRKDYGKPSQNIRVKLDPEESSSFQIFQVFTVVENEESMEDPEREMTMDQAKEYKPDVQIDDEITLPLPYRDEFGRIAAQTAKQVIVQRLREAERDVLFEEFKEKEHMLLNGLVQQIDMDTVIVSLGKVNAVMPPREQIKGEYYTANQRIKVFVKEVAESNRGPQIIVSRSDPRFIQELFALEVPEIQAGTVEIKSISREAGSRTKMAVFSSNPALDPVGSCVGQRGTRVQAVLAEVGDEKIDIILWDENSEQFIRNALSPAKVRAIDLDPEHSNAKVQVDTDQLSLAIGKGGQNVRLASKLTGFSLDILRDEVIEVPARTTGTDTNADTQPETKEQKKSKSKKKKEEKEEETVQ